MDDKKAKEMVEALMTKAVLGTPASASVTEKPDPIRIELNRGMNGNHGWSIRVTGTDPKIVLDQVKKINDDMKLLYYPAQEMV
jgi:hypothetical protein